MVGGVNQLGLGTECKASRAVVGDAMPRVRMSQMKESFMVP